MFLDAIDALHPLLANIDDRTIRCHVLVDFDGNRFRDAHSRYRAEEVEHLVLSFCFEQESRHLLCI